MIYIQVIHKDRITGLALLTSNVEFPTQAKAMVFLKRQHKYKVDTSTKETVIVHRKKKTMPKAKYDTVVIISEK